MSENVQKIVDDIISQIKFKKLNVSSCVDIIVVGMEVVEHMQHMTGEEKCKLLIEALNRIEKDTDVIPDNVLYMLNKINELDMIKPIIDIIVLASHGKVDINKTTNTIFGCLQICW
jgi:uncharacterized protein Yka (UPF0111/DUF47 family)